MRRVLMISPHFPPDSTAATHRVRLLAPHLPAHGWQPTVLTVDPRDYEGRLDPDLLASVPPHGQGRANESVAGEREPCGRRRRSRRSCLSRAVAGCLGAAGRRTVRRRVHHDLPVLSGAARPAPQAATSRLRSCSTTRTRGSASGAGPLARLPGGRPDLKSRFSRFVATHLEPYALDGRRRGDGGVPRHLRAGPRANAGRAAARAAPSCRLAGISRDLEFAGGGPRTFPDDGLVHLSYVGTLLPTGFDTLRAVLRAVASLAPAIRRRTACGCTSSARATSARPTRLRAAAGRAPNTV